ncbi:unnamed protein product [Calypogeia fissa]
MDHDNTEAVEFQEKIRLSAREIVGYKEGAIWSSPLGFIPGPHQVIMGTLLTFLCGALCRTWEVPENFKKSLERNLVAKEALDKQFFQFLEMFTGGFKNDAHSSMIALVSLGMMVSGAILYVKAAYDPQGWNENRSEQEYDRLIKEFVDLHGPDLKQYVGESHSLSDVFSADMDRDQVHKQLAEFFDRVSAQRNAP